MTAITTTEHHLSKKDLELADEIARGMEDVEGQMLNICYAVAKACNQRDELFIQPFLERALPTLKPSSRRNVLQAGRERMANLNSARRRAELRFAIRSRPACKTFRRLLGFRVGSARSRKG